MRHMLALTAAMLLCCSGAAAEAAFSMEDFIVLHPGETGLLPVSEAVFSIDDPSVASVSADGRITALQTGLATVTVTQPTAGEPDSLREITLTVVPDRSGLSPNRVKIAAQLYNFSSVTGPNDTRGLDVIRQLAAMGYDGVEWFSGSYNLAADKIYGTEPQIVAAMLDALGLESAGLHYNGGLLRGVNADLGRPGTLNMDAMEKIIALCQALNITLLWPQSAYPMTIGAPVDLDRIPPEQIETLLAVCNEEFDMYRKLLSPLGIRTMYHNHAEFYRDESDEYGLDRIGSDVLQVDYYWLVKGLNAESGDEDESAALAWLRERAGQVASLHIKDGIASPLTYADCTSWGSGELNIPAVIEIAREFPNIEWVVVENDRAASIPGGPLADAAASMSYIRETLVLDRD